MNKHALAFLDAQRDIEKEFPSVSLELDGDDFGDALAIARPHNHSQISELSTIVGNSFYIPLLDMTVCN